MMTKICITCQIEKKEEDFCLDKSKENGRHSVCRLCKKEYDAEHRYVKFERIYGINKEQYFSLLNVQNNRCAICNREVDLDIDHCHETGRVRGLLCTNCNTSLGKLNTPELLYNAINYLKRHVSKAPSTQPS